MRQYRKSGDVRLDIRVAALVFCLVLISVLLVFLKAYADENPLIKMRDEAVSYFKPMTGKIIKIEDEKVIINLGTKDDVKVGMRFTVVRETAPFKHPVTKEPIGNLESSVGILEIKEVSSDSSVALITEGNIQEGDKVRISAMKVNMLFCQAKGIDWYLADSYFRKLKETGRFNMIETGIETDESSKAVEEAKRLHADVALLLSTKAVNSDEFLTQRLFWVSNDMLFNESNSKVDVAYAKELKFGERFFNIHPEEAFLTVDLPFKSKFITTGDVNGDGKQEIIISTDNEVRIFTPGVDLETARGDVQIEGSSIDDYLWIDSIDLNKNGRDEIIITSMKKNEVISYIYELNNNKFVLLHKDNIFMRRVENRLLAQAYSYSEGFDGPVFEVVYEGGYKRGSAIKIPEGVNIYDFIYIDNPQSGKLILAYDNSGFLNLYDKNGINMWKSKTNTGGFLETFKKPSPSAMVEKGEWSVKDRLFLENNGVLFVNRIPLLKIIKGLWYKRSQIKNLWWNGLSMEENVLIDNISGTILDYTVAGDKIIILASPLFGIKPGNILKGENPIKTILYIYSNNELRS